MPSPPARTDESLAGETASLFPSDDPLSPHERRIFALLKADEATHIDEIVERLEPELSSSEIFAAWFELELPGKSRQLAGRSFVKTFQPSAFRANSGGDSCRVFAT